MNASDRQHVLAPRDHSTSSASINTELSQRTRKDEYSPVPVHPEDVTVHDGACGHVLYPSNESVKHGSKERGYGESGRVRASTRVYDELRETLDGKETWTQAGAE